MRFDTIGVRSIQLPIMDTMVPMEDTGYLHIRMSSITALGCVISSHITMIRSYHQASHLANQILSAIGNVRISSCVLLCHLRPLSSGKILLGRFQPRVSRLRDPDARDGIGNKA